ncbi:MAG TPA: SGNH/GDSL hydrolase family protein [Verrucomicrobiota bacterium]|jgi:hypothetical protein|nr:SGNH/GDSL hydrolase family protein [Verrucomicrobiota bacterium]HQL79129.1 SGNH/GDSL hydrolase family protein [Verrucomicrobiota bacterium]
MTTQPSPRIQKLKRWYVASAVTLLNCVLLGAVGGGVFLLAREAKRGLAARARVSPVERKYGNRVFSAYPDLGKEDVRTLLWETWTRPCVFEAFTQFSERPYTGRFVNVSANGFRHSQNQAAWPPDTNAFNVFFFGGSTAFGYGLPDGQTVASFLQAWLRTHVNPRANVYNFGRAYYYSSQEVVLFMRLLTAGHVPSMAVFMDGLNDAVYVDDLPKFSQRVQELMEANKKWMQPSVPASRAQEATGKGMGQDESRELADRVVQRYQANLRTAKALAGAYGVRAAFVWQPVPTYKYNLEHHQFKDGGFRRHQNARFVYERMNDCRGEFAGDKSFIWCADLQEGAAESFYLDEVHYNAVFARRLADRIGEELLARGLATVP